MTVRHPFNRAYIFISVVLFFFGVVGADILLRRSFARDSGNDLLSSANAEEQSASAAAPDAPPPASKGDIFFDREFLKIEESIITSKVRELDMHKKVTIAPDLPPPQNVSVVDVKNGELVTIIWDPDFSPGRTVSVFRSEAGGEESKIGEASASALGYHDTTVEVGARYSYTLESVSEDDKKSETVGPFAIGPIEDLLPPSPPSAPAYTVTEDGFVAIAWIDPPVSDLESIVVYRSTVKGILGERIYKVAPEVQSYTDKDVETGRTYYYLLRSEDKNGNESANEIVENRLGNPNIFTPVF